MLSYRLCWYDLVDTANKEKDHFRNAKTFIAVSFILHLEFHKVISCIDFHCSFTLCCSV